MTDPTVLDIALKQLTKEVGGCEARFRILDTSAGRTYDLSVLIDPSLGHSPEAEVQVLCRETGYSCAAKILEAEEADDA